MKTSKKLMRICLLITTILIALPLWGRDWVKDPPWVEIPSAAKIAAVGDIHGAFAEFAASLESLGVAQRKSAESFDLEWTGGTTVLVFTGDYGDRGVNTKEVYDAVMDLETQASKAGGLVIPLLGNHEVLLLNGTVEMWANTLKPPKKQHYQNTIDSFTKAGLDFHQAISPSGKYGSWIRRRPLFAIVDEFLFVHAGFPQPPDTRSNIAADYREAIDEEQWSGKFLMNEKGVLWNRNWWDDNELVNKNLQAFGIRGVVFGHSPSEFGEKGYINTKDNRLVCIDIGMTPVFAQSHGGGLMITLQPSGKLLFRARYPDKPETILFQLDPGVSDTTEELPNSAVGR